MVLINKDRITIDRNKLKILMSSGQLSLFFAFYIQIHVNVHVVTYHTYKRKSLLSMILSFPLYLQMNNIKWDRNDLPVIIDLANGPPS